tara:strand:- start:12012 stop:12449 length:438 start_codon:yes stop_codon:yes gene_type:complete
MNRLKLFLSLLVCLLLASCAASQIEFKQAKNETVKHGKAEFLKERYMLSIGYAEMNLGGKKEVLKPFAMTLIKSKIIFIDGEFKSGKTLPMSFVIKDEYLYWKLNESTISVPLTIFKEGGDIFIDKLPLKGEALMRRVEVYLKQA